MKDAAKVSSDTLDISESTTVYGGKYAAHSARHGSSFYHASCYGGKINKIISAISSKFFCDEGHNIAFSLRDDDVIDKYRIEGMIVFWEINFGELYTNDSDIVKIGIFAPTCTDDDVQENANKTTVAYFERKQKK